MKIKCNIDTTAYSSKPKKKQFSDIQNRLARGQTEIDLKSLAKLLSRGGSFKPALLNGRSSDTWISQSLFALDFDGGCTIKEFLERCSILNIYPCFVYTTFSHQLKGVDKFRAVFCTSAVIDNLALRHTTIITLMELFPSSDKVVKDPARMFLGGKSLVYEKYDATINPKQLLDVFVAYTRKTEMNSSTASKKIKKLCSNIGLNMINGAPSVFVINNTEIANAQESTPLLLNNTENGPIAGKSLYNKKEYIENLQSSVQKSYVFIYFLEDKDFLHIKTTIEESKKGLSKPPKSDITNMVTAKITGSKKIEKFDFSKFNKCKLYNDFLDGKVGSLIQGKHNAVFHLACNFHRYMGAEKILLDNLANNSFIDELNKAYTIKECSDKDYVPSRCEGFCPYYGSDKCTNKTKNILTFIEPKRDEVVELEATIFNPLKQCEEESMQMLERFLRLPKDANTLVVNNSYVGVGKTMAIKQIVKQDPNILNGYVFAYENHDLAKEMFKELNIPNSIYLKELELKNKAVQNMYEGFLRQGLHKEAYKMIGDYKDSLDRRNEDYNEIEKFLKLKVKAKTFDGAIFTTHSRITLSSNHISIFTKGYIIDEDIKNSIVSNVEIPSVNILENLIYRAEEASKNLKYRDSFMQIIGDIKFLLSCINEAKNNPNTVVDLIKKRGICARDSKQKLNFIKFFKNQLTYEVFKDNKIKTEYINIGDLLDIGAISYSDYHKQCFSYIKRALPKSNVYIMSATINTDLLKKKNVQNEYFCSRFKDYIFLDSNMPELKGKLYHHLRAYNKSDFRDTRKFEETIKMLRKKHPNIKNIITFKFASEGTYKRILEMYGFDNNCMYFGKCSGSNSIAGQDLIVLGTPKPPIHSILFLAHACGIKPGVINYSSDNSIKYTVERNGYKYKANTVSIKREEDRNIIEDIQAYLIETDLLQAVGRARITRNEVEVYNYSRYILKGSTPF